MITFFVAGVPVPKGSAKAFMNKGMRFPVVVQDNAERQKPWASMIGYTAQRAGAEMMAGPVKVEAHFFMPRLKSHYGSGKKEGVIKANAPNFHISKPDLDKLIRCIKDALTGIVWKDDSQVAEVSASKVYSNLPGVRIWISAL